MFLFNKRFISSAINGFSRRILWLEVASSNNDHRIVAQYFLNYARQLGGTARIVRGDRGSDIGNLAAFQRPMWPLGSVRFTKYSVFSNVHRKVFIVVQI